jgi:hypothetical protein
VGPLESRDQTVDFSSYRALLESIEVPPGRAVTARDFQGLFKRHEASLRFTGAQRAYWNAVLARAEVDSSYRPARRLWRRERVGHYFPSSVGIRVPGDSGSSDEFVALDQLLAAHQLDPDDDLPARPPTPSTTSGK